VQIQYASVNEHDLARERARQHLAALKRRSTEAGVAVVERVASAAEELIEMRAPSEDSEREVMDTVTRSLDLMALLVHDAGRRRQGYPPAALHEAVHVLLEHVERIKPQLH
jgi:hypothetical protein